MSLEKPIGESLGGEPGISDSSSQLVVVLEAGSGEGKTFVAQQLWEEGLVAPIPSWTTRPPREGEQDTVYDHRFVDHVHYQAVRRRGGFIVESLLYGYEYGLPPVPADRLPTLVIAKTCVIPDLRKKLPLVRVFHLESTDTPSQIAERMRKRGQDETDIARRVAELPHEREVGRDIADRVFVAEGHPVGIMNGVRRALAEEVTAFQRLV